MTLTSIAGVDLVDLDDLPPDHGRWLIHGPQGTGKTSLAATIAEVGPTLFIDLVGEKGVKSFRGGPFAANIRVARPTSITELDDVFYALARGDSGFRAVVVDSATSVQKMAMRYMLGHSETAVREIKQNTAPADQRTWGQTLDIMVDFATFWFSLADGNRPNPMHVIVTAQTKVIEDEVAMTRVRQPDVQKGALPLFKATPDYIVYTDLEDDMENISEDGSIPKRHILRFGSDPDYSTKARVPVDLRGKIPPILGRTSPLNLVNISRVLKLGGIPPKAAAPAAAATTAAKES